MAWRAALALAAILAVAKADLKTMLMENNEWIDACTKETGFTSDDINAVWATLDSPMKEGRCYIGCMLEKATLLENGKMSAANGKKLASSCYEGDKLKMIEGILDSCAAEVTSTDRCESGPLVLQCLKKKKTEAGLEQ